MVVLFCWWKKCKFIEENLSMIEEDMISNSIDMMSNSTEDSHPGHVFLNHINWASNATTIMNNSLSVSWPDWHWFTIVYYTIFFVWSFLGVFGNGLTILETWEFESSILLTCGFTGKNWFYCFTAVHRCFNVDKTPSQIL